MSLRLATAKLASPKKESSLMIEFQSTAFTRGPDPLRPSRRPPVTSRPAARSRYLAF